MTEDVDVLDKKEAARIATGTKTRIPIMAKSVLPQYANWGDMIRNHNRRTREGKKKRGEVMIEAAKKEMECGE